MASIPQNSQDEAPTRRKTQRATSDSKRRRRSKSASRRVESADPTRTARCSSKTKGTDSSRPTTKRTPSETSFASSKGSRSSQRSSRGNSEEARRSKSNSRVPSTRSQRQNRSPSKGASRAVRRSSESLVLEKALDKPTRAPRRIKRNSVVKKTGVSDLAGLAGPPIRRASTATGVIRRPSIKKPVTQSSLQRALSETDLMASDDDEEKEPVVKRRTKQSRRRPESGAEDTKSGRRPVQRTMSGRSLRGGIRTTGNNQEDEGGRQPLQRTMSGRSLRGGMRTTGADQEDKDTKPRRRRQKADGQESPHQPLRRTMSGRSLRGGIRTTGTDQEEGGHQALRRTMSGRSLRGGMRTTGADPEEGSRQPLQRTLSSRSLRGGREVPMEPKLGPDDNAKAIDNRRRNRRRQQATEEGPSIQSQLEELTAENERRLEALLALSTKPQEEAKPESAPPTEITTKSKVSKRKSAGGRILKAFMMNFSTGDDTKKQSKSDNSFPSVSEELSMDASIISDYGSPEAFPSPSLVPAA